jgi:hypothetical protein
MNNPTVQETWFFIESNPHVPGGYLLGIQPCRRYGSLSSQTRKVPGGYLRVQLCTRYASLLNQTRTYLAVTPDMLLTPRVAKFVTFLPSSIHRYRHFRLEVRYYPFEVSNQTRTYLTIIAWLRNGSSLELNPTHTHLFGLGRADLNPNKPLRTYVLVPVCSQLNVTAPYSNCVCKLL